eukprot:Clim_evm112s149 gene=Clim_evmTU112s149
MSRRAPNLPKPVAAKGLFKLGMVVSALRPTGIIAVRTEKYRHHRVFTHLFRTVHAKIWAHDPECKAVEGDFVRIKHAPWSAGEKFPKVHFKLFEIIKPADRWIDPKTGHVYTSGDQVILNEKSKDPPIFTDNYDRTQQIKQFRRKQWEQQQQTKLSKLRAK